jgi:hypothetical protein
MNKGRVSTAVLLIGLGLWYLAVAMSPAVKAFAYGERTWPIQIVGFGLLFFLAGIFSWVPALFIPGTIITGIGGLLYYQNFTGNWESWSYAWALIPGFVGVGLVLFGVFGRKWGAIVGGLWNIAVSLILFSIFGTAFGNIVNVDKVWPVALVVIGIFILFGAFRRKKTS